MSVPEGSHPMSAPTGMCPHCGAIVRVANGGLTYRHGIDDEHGRTIVPCPGSQQNPRCAESDARLLWNGKPNPHFTGSES